MKIDNSFIFMDSQNTKTMLHDKKEKLSARGNLAGLNRVSEDFLKSEVMNNPVKKTGALYDKNGNKIDVANQGKILNSSEDEELTSQQIMEQQAKEQMEMLREQNEVNQGEKIPTIEEIVAEIKRNIVKMLHAMLGGDPKEINDSIENMRRTIRMGSMASDGIASTDDANYGDLTITYEKTETFYSHQSTQFEATGIINTSDGRQINLHMNFKSEKELMFTSHTKFEGNVNIPEPQNDFVDPLVINLDVPSAGLSDITIDFDLDADGVMDEISFVNHGSGFLALDKNGDGIINDGRELFGPQSGDGFKDLSLHDEDGNGWIDENDSIFDKLKLWTIGSDGRPTLISLKNVGIGAIYLKNVMTSMELTDSTDTTRGILRKTGIYLKENGQAGTIQHIDLAG